MGVVVTRHENAFHQRFGLATSTPLRVVCADGFSLAYSAVSHADFAEHKHTAIESPSPIYMV